MKTLSSQRRLAALVVAALLGATAVSAQTSTLYGVTFFDNQLIKLNPVTGAGSLVASLSESISAYGLGVRGSRLYTFDPGTDRIREIDRRNGNITGSFDIGVGDLTGEGDLAFRSDGVGFLSSALTPEFGVANDLFRFDLASGTSRRIGTTDVVLDGLVFSGGLLYAIGQEAEARLYVVDQDTAALTSVGLLGIANNSPFAALTVSSTGNLYGAINDRLYAIDKMTGLASELDASVLDTGYASVSGLAFTPVPEPSTYGLAGAAALMAIAAVRRLRRTRVSPAHRV